jgi:hexosaminidase
VEHLRPEARGNILGVEAQVWSETIKGSDMLEYYLLPKMIGFSESAWSDERRWEQVEDRESRTAMIGEDWNVFANIMAWKELPKLAYLNGGYNYRLPPPGAIIEEGMLKANVEYPGLTIRYTVDGTEPTVTSPLLDGPVAVSDVVRLKCFDAAGRASRQIIIGPQ